MKIRISFALAALLIPLTLVAGMRPPQELGKLYENSKFVFVGAVEGVTLLQDRGINGQEYSVEIAVVTPLKGFIETGRIKIRNYIGGTKGFDILLQPKQKGVFFLRSLENGEGQLTHWGSVALFDASYFN